LIHAQQVKTPPAYVIAEVEVTDPTNFQKYAVKVPETQMPFDGHSLVRGGKIQALEGEAPKRIVVIAFDNAEKARAWYDSPAYEAIKPIRLSSAKTRMFIVEGGRPPLRGPDKRFSVGMLMRPRTLRGVGVEGGGPIYPTGSGVASRLQRRSASAAGHR
jgi:uncharacterized protein (DUF1330 family)